MAKQIILETGRLRAVTWDRADAFLLHSLHANADTTSYIAGDKPWDEAKAREKLEKYRYEHETDGIGKYKIETLHGVFVGRAGVSIFNREQSEFELGYVLAKDFWGQGFATEIASAFVKHFFEMDLTDRLIAFSDKPNVASHRVLTKLGMNLEGERLVGGSSTLQFAISKSSWLERPALTPC
jgi:[ribosomal protein S5]-alanine N-acetyltransferase